MKDFQFMDGRNTLIKPEEQLDKLPKQFTSLKFYKFLSEILERESAGRFSKSSYNPFPNLICFLA